MPIHAKINQVMKAVRGVEKTRTNTHGKFKYAGHEDVNDALRGHFAALGIVRCAAMVNCQILDGGTILAHCEVSYTDAEDGSCVMVPMWAVQPAQTSGKTVTAQQIGQALSYATKNVEFKLFALTGDNEEDSDSTEAYNPRARSEEPADLLTQGGAAVRAGELITMYLKAQTLAEVDEVTAIFKAEWKDLKVVKGLSEKIVEVRAGAQKRLSA